MSNRLLNRDKSNKPVRTDSERLQFPEVEEKSKLQSENMCTDKTRKTRNTDCRHAGTAGKAF